MENATYRGRSNILGFLIGCGFGIAVGLGLFAYRASEGGHNLMQSFTAVRLGMSAEEAERTLVANGVRCNFQIAANVKLAVCGFSDYTHEYRIAVGVADRRVIRKTSSFRIPKLTN